MPNKQLIIYNIKRIILVLLAAVLKALYINIFVRPPGIIPGGFTGLALLLQEVCLKYWSFQIPYSVILFSLNAVPAIFCFKFIGKKFTLYSCLMIFVSGILTDWMPQAGFTQEIINALNINDIFLSVIFGGIACAVSTALCLYADATAGGTDFIAIFISEKYRRDAWNYILAGNCVILAVAGFLFSLDIALYSIIFQFTTTVAIIALYKGYQQKTLLIITNKPAEVLDLTSKMTHHGATSFDGTGSFEEHKQVLLYSVVPATEVSSLINAIIKIDSKAFINVIKTEHLNGGYFFIRPKD